MANKITEKYFIQDDFGKKADQVLAEVVDKTGFVMEKEIYRGIIYEKKKVGSIVYQGQYQDKPAVLKLQGLRPEIEEAAMIAAFNSQNQSQLIRLPQVYVSKPWIEAKEYGFLISEFITAPKLFRMPFASDHDMKIFADFYQEYRTKAVTKPWFEPETSESLKFVSDRLEVWLKISQAKGRLNPSDYQPFVEQFKQLAGMYYPSVPMIFSHGHLSANDVHVSNGTFILTSNLFWSYRPQWYDLAFNVWACMQHIRDKTFTLESWLGYFNKWLSVYNQIPVVAADKDFQRKFFVSMLERMMGSILVDVGTHEIFEQPGHKEYFSHLLNLHQRFFEYLTEKL